MFVDTDARIRLISLIKHSGGPAYPRNVVIKEAGVFISFLDADDEWQQIKLKKQVSYIVCFKIAFSCSGYDVISFTSAEVVVLILRRCALTMIYWSITG